MVSVATEMGAFELTGICTRTEELRENIAPGEAYVHVGRLDEAGMCEAIGAFDLVLDATHPYAVEASKNISAACAGKGVLYQRIERDRAYGGPMPDEVYMAKSLREAAEFLSGVAGNILLTTGSKNLSDYTKRQAFEPESQIAVERLFVRVLPTHEAISACEEAGIIPSHIIAMHGPFSRDLNTALIRQYDIRYLVTKESGPVGGFDEKVKSCIETGIGLVVVKAPNKVSR